MRWAEVKINVTSQAAEAVAAIASEYAPSGVAIFNYEEAASEARKSGLTSFELSEIGISEGAEVRLYLTDDEQLLSSTLSELRSRLHSEVNSGAAGDSVMGINVRFADESEWSGWKQSFKPFRLGSKFVITPTCEVPVSKGDDLVIRIDPGQAFGTGQHATTSGCIVMLEKYIKGGERVLDVGSGTGILSIAAAMLGSGAVLSVDIDPVAVRCATENVRQNAVEDRVRVKIGDSLQGIEGRFDVIVSNILSETIVGMASRAFELLESGGIFISAGFIQKTEMMVKGAIEASGFKLFDRIQEDDWVILAARKPLE